MATNIIQRDPTVITVTAAAAVSSGDLVFQGADLVGIALADAANGADFALQIEGIVNVTKKTGETWAQGDKIYAKPSTQECSKTYDATNYTTFVGVAVEVVGSSVLDGNIKLRGGAEAEVDLDDVVTKSLFDANTIIYATADNTPLALPVGASTFLGRKSTGNIVAMSTTEARTELNVENGADVTDATNVAAAGAVMDTDLAYWQATVNSGGATATVALATASFTAGKPIFGSIINNTSNTVAIAKIYDDATNITVVLTGDPGASNASVALWQDKR